MYFGYYLFERISKVTTEKLKSKVKKKEEKDKKERYEVEEWKVIK